MCEYRVGHGYDVHRLVENRKLILGGVEIPHKTGLLGHSDADVLLHAVMDAVIGALALGDIGKHFPDNSSEFKDISSMELLKSTKALMDKKGAAVVNLDATLILQKPKISDYIYQMRENISKILECDVECVNIKATTEEKLGFTGREEGVSAHAVVLLEIKK
jgi:2-C-methyl-D-erythritol 2,4-cyclodiphosphate synthase